MGRRSEKQGIDGAGDTQPVREPKAVGRDGGGVALDVEVAAGEGGRARPRSWTVALHSQIAGALPPSMDLTDHRPSSLEPYHR